MQARAVPGATAHADGATLPDAGPLLIVANEFFDALPIRQMVRTDAGWRERVLINDRLEHGRRFLPALGDADMTEAVPAVLRDAAQGAVVETLPMGAAILHDLATRIARQGGALLIIDYGHAGPATGDTMQAVQAHRFADPYVDPGTRDLTAHVDFTALAIAAADAGLAVAPLAEQGAFLLRLGIGARAAMLERARPDQRAELAAALLRLTDTAAMGRLFKVMAAIHADWPMPEGLR
jgi:SAM-dependent MidA family methyltransferase